MPKNTKKRANKDKARKQTGEVAKRPLPLADDQQLYGKTERSMGDRRFEIKCADGETRLGKLRGKIRKRKKSWLGIGQWVIVAVREYQTSKVDIIEILSEDEVRRLEVLGELSTNTTTIETNEDDLIDFDFDDI